MHNLMRTAMSVLVGCLIIGIVWLRHWRTRGGW